MISRYMQELLLYRLSISNYHERFILKGGALLYAYDRFEARPTLDIGFGDVVTPAPQELTFPALIDTMPQAEIKAYSLETVVAEKFHAMI